MAGYRKYILIIILLAALAAVFFALPDSRLPKTKDKKPLDHTSFNVAYY